MLKSLCNINSTSGNEEEVREFIINEIKDFCDYKIDPLGSIIAFKKGKKTPKKSVMFAAHMDEVALIITGITDDGYLKFHTVGGIDSRVIIDRVVKINDVFGVIGTKAVHLLSSEEKNTATPIDSLAIDIGAKDKSEASKYVTLGDCAYFKNDYTEFSNGYVKSKAIDDRFGCMLLIELIKCDLEYDTTFCFNVQEEVGLRGSKCTSFEVQSDISIILESTTAADLDGVKNDKRVCVLGGGPVVSFMDNRTMYDKELYTLAFDVAKKNNIKCQTKTAIAGGNDAGAIQTSGKGSKVLAISLPTRYIHSGASVAKLSDIDDMKKLIRALINVIYD